MGPPGAWATPFPGLTSLVERVLWASRLRMTLELMLLYGKKRSLTCGGAEGAEGDSAMRTTHQHHSPQVSEILR